jgi:hypothetical protein
MVDTRKVEGVGGYDGIWMNEKDQTTFRYLIDNKHFHVDIHEQSHHEMNIKCKNDKLP